LQTVAYTTLSLQDDPLCVNPNEAEQEFFGVLVGVGVLVSVTSQAAVNASGGSSVGAGVAVFFLAGFPLVAETGTLTNDRSMPDNKQDTPKT